MTSCPMARDTRNAWDEYVESGTYALFMHSGAGYDSFTAVRPDGTKARASWVLMPPKGRRLKLADGEEMPLAGSLARGKPFATMADAVAFARDRLGVVGWRWRGGVHKGFWLQDNAGDPTPRACEETVNTSGSSRWSSFRACGRPCEPDGDMCKTHAGHKRRADEKEAAWRAKWEAEDATNAASRDWAQRLHDEFGVRASASTNKHLRVLVEPEHLYGLLVELAGVLRDVDVPWPERPEDDRE